MLDVDAAGLLRALTRLLVLRAPAKTVSVPMKDSAFRDALKAESGLPWTRVRSCIGMLSEQGVIEFSAGSGRGNLSVIRFARNPAVVLAECARSPHIDAPRKFIEDIHAEVARLRRLATAPATILSERLMWWDQSRDPGRTRLVVSPGSDAAFADDDLYGRRADLTSLAEAISTRYTVALVGQPGVGKTHLMAVYQRMLTETPSSGLRIVWLKLTRQSHLEQLGRHLLGDIRGGGAESLAYAVFEELKRTPHLVILDNFELILRPDGTPEDPGYRTILSLVTHHGLGGSRVLLGSWWLPRDCQGRTPYRLLVEGLDEEAVLELLWSRGIDADPPLASSLVRKTDGNPLAIETMLETLRGNGDEFMPTGGRVAPEAIQLAIGRLSANELLVMGAVAVAVDEASERLVLHVLHQVGNLSDREALRHLDNLVGVKLLLKDRWDRQLGCRQYSMHILSRTHLLEERLDADQLRDLHRAAMDYWHELGSPEHPDDPAWRESLRHALQAEEFTVAAKVLADTGVGRKLFDTGGLRELRSYLEEIFGLDSGSAHLSVGRLAAKADVRRFSARLGPLVRLLGNTYWRLGDLVAAHRCFAGAFADLGNSAADLVALAGVRLDQGEHHEGLRLAREALAIAQRQRDRNSEVDAWSWIGYALDDSGPAQECVHAYRMAIELTVELGDERARCLNEARLGMILWKTGDVEEARGHFGHAYRLALRFDDPYMLGLAEGDTGHYFMDRPGSTPADVDVAESWYAMGLATHRKAGVRRGEGFWLGQLGRVEMRRGDYQRSRELLVEAIRVHLDVGDAGAIPRHLWYLAELHWAQGTPADRVLAYFETAVERFERVGALIELTLVRDRLDRYRTELGQQEREPEQVADRVREYMEMINLHLDRREGDLP